MPYLNSTSKGEIFSYLQERIQTRRTKKCKNLKWKRGVGIHHHIFRVFCLKDWVNHEDVGNVMTQSVGGLTEYKWSICPPDCPYFNESENLLNSLEDIEINKELDKENKTKFKVIKRKYSFKAGIPKFLEAKVEEEQERKN